MKIAVLSRNPELYSTRRLVETGKRNGHDMVVIDHLSCDIVMEKNNPRVYYKGEFLSDIDAIIPRIGASVTFYGSALVRQFEMMKVFTAVDSQALLRSRDKLRSLQILSRLGIGLPKTVFTNYSKEVDEIIDSVGTPLIVKLLEGTQGVGVMLVENKKVAKSVIQAFNGLKARIIVQEFIEEAKGTDIRAFVVNGKVVGAMKRTAKEGDFRSNVHRGGSSEIIKLNKEERSTAIKAAKAMRLGIAGVDMLPSDRGPLIMEVNSSPGLGGIEKATGVDIAGKIIDYVEEETMKMGKKRYNVNA